MLRGKVRVFVPSIREVSVSPCLRESLFLSPSLARDPRFASSARAKCKRTIADLLSACRPIFPGPLRDSGIDRLMRGSIA